MRDKNNFSELGLFFHLNFISTISGSAKILMGGPQVPVPEEV